MNIENSTNKIPENSIIKEESFQNEKEDRFVFLDREYNMSCSYHYKFKKWVPLQISLPGSKLILSKDLPFLEKNKH